EVLVLNRAVRSLPGAIAQPPLVPVLVEALLDVRAVSADFDGPVSVSSASQIAVSSMRLCVVPCALPDISRTVPACSISAAQPPRPCIPFTLQLPSVQTTVFTPDSLPAKRRRP